MIKQSRINERADDDPDERQQQAEEESQPRVFLGGGGLVAVDPMALSKGRLVSNS